MKPRKCPVFFAPDFSKQRFWFHASVLQQKYFQCSSSLKVFCMISKNPHIQYLLGAKFFLALKAVRTQMVKVMVTVVMGTIIKDVTLMEETVVYPKKGKHTTFAATANVFTKV